MTKAEKIQEYVLKIAKKHGLTYEEAEQLKVTQEYIKQIEEEKEHNE